VGILPGRSESSAVTYGRSAAQYRTMAVEASWRGVWWRARPLAWGLAISSAVLVGGAVVGAVLGGLSLDDVVNGFVVTNAVMALSFSLCGLILATQRPANPIGWLFVLDGLGHAVTAAAVPLIALGLAEQWPVWLVRAITTAGVYSWPWSISLFLPLALLLFPDGRLPGRRWSWLMWAAVATAPLFVVEMGAHPSSLVRGGPAGYLTFSEHDRLAPVWQVAELRVVLLYGACLIALAVRYRRSDERERRQLLWLILATLLTLGVLIPWGLFLVGPVLMLLAVPLIGVAVTVAILRYQLLDIRLVLSRAVLYLLLTGGVVLVFEVLVAVLDVVLRRQAGVGTSVLATVLVAVGFNPARERLQRLMQRAVAATRFGPSRAAAQAGTGPGDAEGGLGGVVESVRSALDLPFVALRGAHGEINAAGTAPETLHVTPLVNGAERLGELVVGLRTGQGQLDSADRAVLDMLATPLAVAMHTTARCAELQRSRERIINVREQERRRLRQDLHDGLRPMLTNVTTQADLARTLVIADPTRATEALTELHRQTSTLIEAIRQVTDELRPTP
jgi:two-component system NarL family sensor kinase